MLANMNRLLCAGTPTGKFATFFLARVDLEPLRLTYCNAGHNPPVLYRRGGAMQLLECGGTVVGAIDGIGFAQETIALGPGDRVVMYTDGVSEAANAAGDMYTDERVQAFAAGLPRELPARELSDRILADVHTFLNGTEAGDDITLVTLRVLEREPATTDGAATTADADASVPSALS
jgi:sigma-B regulation protein RsbU (phosphoserine phosphatase)